MKTEKKILIICVAIPLALGALAGFITRDGADLFALLRKPPLSPPGWLFPVVWTVLYLCMGVASYLILTSGARRIYTDKALQVYGAQLAVNFFWPVFFFNFQWFFFSLLWLLLLWGLVFYTWALFRRISGMAARLLIPYLVWTAFAGYLNLGVWILN